MIKTEKILRNKIGKKCYAIGEYEATDTLYNIFESIFENENELEDFPKSYK